MAPNLFEMLGIPNVGGGLQDFGSFGAQQPNVAQATSPAPRPGIQNMAGLMPDRQAALTQSPAYAGIQSRLGQIGPKQNDLLESLNKGPGVSKSTAMINGVMTLLPLIMGLAVAKKRGGVIGGQFGMQMGESLNASAEKKSKDEYDKDKFQYDLLKDESKTLGDRAFQLEKDTLTGSTDDQADVAKEFLKAKINPSASKTFLTVQNNEGTNQTVSEPVRAQNQADMKIINQADDVINYVNQIAPQLLDEKPAFNEDGSLSIPDAGNLMGRKFIDYLGGVQTKEAAAQAEMGTMLAAIIKEQSGTATPDPEFVRLSRNITGDGVLLPAAWPVAIAKIKQLAEKRQRDIEARTEFDDTQNRYPSKVGEVVSRRRQSNSQRPITSLPPMATSASVGDTVEKVGGAIDGFLSQPSANIPLDQKREFVNKQRAARGEPPL